MATGDPSQLQETECSSYNVPLHQMKLLLQRPMFQSDSAEERRLEQELEELVTQAPTKL